MENKKSSILMVVVVSVFSLAIGIAIGMNMGSDSDRLTEVDDLNNSLPMDMATLKNSSKEELGEKLSEVMLPEDEFQKLSQAIFQTGMGLVNAQAQGAGIKIDSSVEDELKKSVEEKYSRKYFAELNAKSMDELSKNELMSILSFYNTEAGVKFLKLSPKIIESTMTNVQADLSQWLPKTVEGLVNKLKEEKGEESRDESEQDSDNKEE